MAKVERAVFVMAQTRHDPVACLDLREVMLDLRVVVCIDSVRLEVGEHSIVEAEQHLQNRCSTSSAAVDLRSLEAARCSQPWRLYDRFSAENGSHVNVATEIISLNVLGARWSPQLSGRSPQALRVRD